MTRQYLDVPYRAKDAVKALGARFDGTVKRWYVEASTDLVAFAAWVPAGTLPVAIAPANLTLATTPSTTLATVRKGTRSHAC